MTVFYNRKVRELGLPSAAGVQRYVHVGFRQSGFIDLPENYLKLPIVDFEHPGIHPMQEFFDITYSGYRTFTVPDMQCAISWGSLKDFELFLESDNVLKYRDVAFIGPFSGLQESVGRFTDHYASVPRELPLVSLSPGPFKSQS